MPKSKQSKKAGQKWGTYQDLQSQKENKVWYPSEVLHEARCSTCTVTMQKVYEGPVLKDLNIWPFQRSTSNWIELMYTVKVAFKKEREVHKNRVLDEYWSEKEQLMALDEMD